MTNTLIVLPNNLGDVIMALPVIEALKKNVPDTCITFLVEEGFEEGAINCKYIDRLFLFPRKQIKQLLHTNNWTDGIELLKKQVNLLKEFQYDRLINLCQHVYIATLLSQFDIPDISGRYFLPQGCHSITDTWSRYLYSIPYSRVSNMLHAVDVYKFIARVPVSSQQGKIDADPAEINTARQFLSNAGLPLDARCALIHPGAAYISKMWPIDHFISLANKLIEDGLWIIITGSNSETDISETIRQQTGERCIVATGKLSFRDSFILATFAEFCITGDTAMMHAAAALGVRIYALFGPTNPVETGPYGAGHVIFSGRCPSRPCFCFECESKLCMKSISPETVYAYIKYSDHTNASCDIYTTTINNDTTYGIIPVHEVGTPYYIKPYAETTRKIFDKSFKPTCPQQETGHVKDELLKMMNTISTIEIQLSNYMENSDLSSIGEYEKLRAELDKTKGITSFLSAYLNTGLNSIPLTNPRGSVQKSIQICHNLILQIRNAVNAL